MTHLKLLRMELPDKDFTRLSFDAPAGHWAVHHLVTGEVRPVPAHMCDPELSYDDEGSGYVHTAGTSEGAIWLADLMHWQAVKDDEGEFYIVKAGVFSKATGESLRGTSSSSAGAKSVKAANLGSRPSCGGALMISDFDVFVPIYQSAS